VKGKIKKMTVEQHGLERDLVILECQQKAMHYLKKLGLEPLVEVEPIVPLLEARHRIDYPVCVIPIETPSYHPTGLAA
jgi:hypothetical protein